MSVIGLNMWIAVELLKTNLHDTKSCIESEITKYNNENMQSIHSMVNMFMKQIKKRDHIIDQLTSNKQALKIPNPFHSIIHNGDYEGNMEKDRKIFQIENELKIKNNELEDSQRRNKQYQKQIETILFQMKVIKNYLEELKKIKNKKEIETQYKERSPVRDLEDEETEILTKMSSLTNLGKIKTDKLDTIKEVTEMSLHSEEDQAELIFSQTDTFQENMSPKTIENDFVPNQVLDSSSFQCVSQVKDINRFLCSKSKEFDRNSMQNQSYEESLCILKNYINQGEQTSHTEQQLKTQIQDCSLIPIPNLKLKKKINQRHLIYENGFTYTGNVAIIKENPRPMGFGQLYKNNQLFYCGHWKNGVFDGWGKIYLPQNTKVRQFNGQLLHGRPHGPGCIKFWNGEKFMGTFSRGKIQGQGTLVSKDGKKQSGFWKNNILLHQQQN